MPYYITDGTTARESEGLVVWSEAYSTTATTHVDIEMASAQSAGYNKFILELYGVDLYENTAQLRLQPMTAANTVDGDGCYGGFIVHGEGNGSVTAYSTSYNNDAAIPLSGKRAGAELSGGYYGNYTINISFNDVAGVGSDPNYYWHGAHRLNATLASQIIGGGTHAGAATRYGLRLVTDYPNNNYLLSYGYTLYALKSGSGH